MIAYVDFNKYAQEKAAVTSTSRFYKNNSFDRAGEGIKWDELRSR